MPIFKDQNASLDKFKNIDPVFYFIQQTSNTKHAKAYLKYKTRGIKSIGELKKLIPFFNSIGWHQSLFINFIL